MAIEKSISLEEHIVAVWYCTLEENKKRLVEYTELLSEDEKERAGRFKFQKDHDCYVISKGILRTLLGKYLSENPKNIQFKYTEYKKPFLALENALKFNVSHSGDKAIFAFTQNQEIGVDIERIKKDFDVLALAQNFFSKTEIVALEKLPKEELFRAFFRCWTRKEALIKAEGSGLSFPLNKFAVSLDSDDSAALNAIEYGNIKKEDWILFSKPLQENYISAVALENPNAEIVYFNWDTHQ